jgi:hypothetical protein
VQLADPGPRLQAALVLPRNRESAFADPRRARSLKRGRRAAARRIVNPTVECNSLMRGSQVLEARPLLLASDDAVVEDGLGPLLAVMTQARSQLVV